MSRFVDNGDGTVTDTKTGLMWQQADDGIMRTWNDSQEYASELDLAGHTGWRLPTIQELVSIVDYERYEPAIDLIFGCASRYYWSGASYASDTDDAWCVGFGDGNAYAYYKSSTGYVRCVRGGPLAI